MKELAKLANEKLTDDAILKFKYEQNESPKKLQAKILELESSLKFNLLKGFVVGGFTVLAVEFFKWF